MSTEITSTASIKNTELATIIEDARAKKKLFDELIVASNDTIAETANSVSSAKAAALAEIDQAKAATIVAKENFDDAVTNINAANTDVTALKTTAIAEIETSKASITAAMGTASTILAEMDKAKLAAATARGAIETTQKSAIADLASINQSKIAVDKLEAAAAAQAATLVAENDLISNKIEELQKKSAPLEELLATLTQIKEGAELERASVAANIATITEAKTNFETLNTQTQAQYDALVKRNVLLDGQISDIGKADESIKQIYKNLFDDTDKVSVRTEIEELRSQVSKILKEITMQRDTALTLFTTFKIDTDKEKKALIAQLTEEFKLLHGALDAEIRALLPSAGAAGLSSTYYDAKSRYAPTSFAGKPGGVSLITGRFSWLRSKFGYNPASVVATIFFYTLFIVPIVGIVLIFYDLLQDLPSEKLIALDLKIIVLRILIALPLATISAFGFMSLRSYRHLYEEYNHKQRVMELYASFRKEISENGTDQQKGKLLTIMLDAVADKSYLAGGASASSVAPIGLDNGEILTKLNAITSLLSNVSKLKS